MADVITEFQGQHRWLSNFWPMWIRPFPDGIDYPSVEHAYQAAKTADLSQRRAIADLRSAGDAKRAGRRVIMRSDWDRVKVETMRRLIAAKFSDPRSELGRLLLATGEAHLVEGNRWGDTFWGVCRGRGDNWLGRILMERRAELRMQFDPT